MSEQESGADECRALTDRIQKLEMARALADSGQPDKALDLLRRLREAYPEQDKRRMIDWLITDLERRGRK